MPITFRSERKKMLKHMYYDMCDSWLEEAEKNPLISPEKRTEMQMDVKEWKVEFKELIESL